MQVEIIDGAVVIAEAYDNVGYARRVRVNGKLYLLCEHWCGGNIEGQCFRDFVSRVPASREEELDTHFQASSHRAIRRFEASLSNGVRLDRFNKTIQEAIHGALYLSCF